MKIKIVPRSLTVRLCLLYASLFLLTVVCVFGSIYLIVEHELLRLTDRDLEEDIVDITNAFKVDGLAGIEGFARVEAVDDGPENKFFIVFNQEGERMFSTELDWWGDFLFRLRCIHSDRSPCFETIGIPKHPEIKARVLTFKEGAYLVSIGTPLAWNERVLKKLLKAIFLGGVPAIIFSVLSGWIVAKKTLSKVKSIERVARQIATGSDLSRRVPVLGAGDEIDQLSNTFNAMLNRLELFVRELNEMLDNTAHDFKTPLARIRTMAETSLTSMDMEAIQGALVEIMNESDKFLSVLNAIMDISEARTGLMALRISDIKVNELFRELESFFSGIASEKSVDFTVLYTNNMEVIKADKARILQALLNIADNAFKFTPPGGAVAVWYDSDVAFSRISISDTGPGIEESMIPRIFERFFRLDASRSTKGRGIGLALAKAFVEAHGGKITVESKTDQGSTFTIWLPH